jgi:hypothetical protein
VLYLVEIKIERSTIYFKNSKVKQLSYDHQILI